MKPKHYKPQYAVAQTVADMQRKFVYPDVDTREAAPFIAGGGGAPTVVVAAANASDLSKGKADFVCTGVNDQQTIQAAINAHIPSSPHQGLRVLLTEGEFKIRMTNQSFEGIRLDYGVIQGMGQEATILNAGATSGSVDDNPILFLASSRGTVRDMSFQGGATNRVTGVFADGYDQVIENCHFDTNGVGVMLTETGQRVVNNHFEGTDGINFVGNGNGNLSIVANNIIDLSGFGIFFGSNAFPGATAIIGNVIKTSSTSEDGINLGVGMLDATVVGNTIRGGSNGIESLDIRAGVIVGNSLATMAANGIRISWSNVFNAGRGLVVADNEIREVGHYGIFIDGDPGGGTEYPTQFLNNHIQQPGFSGLVFDDIDEIVVANNLIVAPGQHGIETFDQCNSFHVHGNTILRPGQSADDTYDGIFLDTNCDDWYIHGNYIRGAAGSPQPRYAINVSAASDDNNTYVGNNAGPATDYGTGNYNDAGTGTVVSWPAAAAPQGDNF